MTFEQDATPLDTDFDDLHKLFEDMKAFAKDHPKHIFIPADDPGFNHTPPRIGRMGWSAFIPHPIGLRDRGEYFDEEAKYWTISLSKITASAYLLESIQSAAGRRSLLANLGLRIPMPASP